jgi:hypothetical protein
MEKIETRLEVNSDQVLTANFTTVSICQCCLLCDNTREIPDASWGRYPWVCDECTEAIAFVKELKHTHDNFDPLKPILD